MKSVKQNIMAASFQIALVVIILLMGVGAANSADILAVLDEDNKIHRIVLNSLRTALENSQAVRQIELRTYNLGANSNTFDVSSNSEAKLIVTIGTRASQAVLESGINKPVMSILVPKSSYELLIKQAEGDNLQRHTSAIYIDQPIERQISLAQSLLPQASTVGVLISTSLAARADELKTALAHHGLGLNLVTVNAGEDPAVGIQRMMQGSDLVLAVYDPLVLQPITAKWLLYMAYKRRLPVIGFSQAYAKAGAMAAVFSTPQQLGSHAGEEIAQWVLDGQPKLPPPQYPKYYLIDFNKPVAESLDIKLPENKQIRGKNGLLLEEGK
jgi:ABC-type uncharacterized transport system substrate-binding protein